MRTIPTSPNASAHAPPSAVLDALREATLSTSYVSMGSRRTNSPHEFYRYPARFSPTFAAAAIAAFSSPGDLVLDPFMGGGTTLIEASAAGRRSLGSDLNTLAAFVTKVKTTPLDEAELDVIDAWLAALPALRQQVPNETDMRAWARRGYFKDLDDVATQPLRHAIAEALTAAGAIRHRVPHNFARCIILRTAQWALDMRREVPTVAQFWEELVNHGRAMAEVASSVTPQNQYQARVLNEPLPGLADAYDEADNPRLILTSPPYPGVYVLYHRWKLRGRREIPAPYWIAGSPDGHGLATYTMSARADQTQDTYFRRLREAFEDLALLCDAGTRLVQVVGFNGGPEQLRRYLDVMASCGFVEEQFPELMTDPDGRLWRQVPNRRWWTEATSLKEAAPHTAREVVLIHRHEP